MNTMTLSTIKKDHSVWTRCNKVSMSDFLRKPTGEAIALQHVVDSFKVAIVYFFQGFFNDFYDVEKTDIAPEEPSHSDFIGGVEDGGGAASGREGFAGEA